MASEVGDERSLEGAVEEAGVERVRNAVGGGSEVRASSRCWLSMSSLVMLLGRRLLPWVIL